VTLSMILDRYAYVNSLQKKPRGNTEHPADKMLTPEVKLKLYMRILSELIYCYFAVRICVVVTAKKLKSSFY